MRRLLAAVMAVGTAALTGCATATPMMHGGMWRASACEPPAGLSGAVVSVRLADMDAGMMPGGMMLLLAPRVVTAGPVTLVAHNVGTRTHELVVLPLADGQRAGRRVIGADGKVDETGSLGEASTTCGSGPGDGIVVGGVSWVTVTLAPGRYELVCNLKNHYARGMYGELDVVG